MAPFNDPLVGLVKLGNLYLKSLLPLTYEFRFIPDLPGLGWLLPGLLRLALYESLYLTGVPYLGSFITSFGSIGLFSKPRLISTSFVLFVPVTLGSLESCFTVGAVPARLPPLSNDWSCLSLVCDALAMALRGAYEKLGTFFLC